MMDLILVIMFVKLNSCLLFLFDNLGNDVIFFFNVFFIIFGYLK